MQSFQTEYRRMPTSGKQTETGKAFEYACAMAIVDRKRNIEAAELRESPQLATARRCYSYLQSIHKNEYQQGAEAAVRIIERLEPKLFEEPGKLVISLQTDSKGIAGDVRDVICHRSDGWEIGLSCKHNHSAVKHSRLSDTIDFGKEWFGKNCSDLYFSEVRTVFRCLRRIREDSLAADSTIPALWRDLPDKEESFYVPVLKSFMKELMRLDKEFPGEIPELLIRYLIGKNDFYKVIMDDKGKFTRIDSININGSLNQASGKQKAIIKVPVVKMPTKFYEIEFKDGSKNTINVVCDQGWSVSMRIHSASSRVEPSLKFDVNLNAMPSSILTQIEPWR